MKTVNIHDAKTHLSTLVEEAAKGETFIISMAGKPMVKVMALDAQATVSVRRLGFMTGHVNIPQDFDTMGKSEIESMFEDGR
ncbi:type II toxin-antitoxin system prevent-host-death family antitoxin [Massilia sp. CCM 9210]|uniref:type II toxin-antitoxin system Phd/YefM family antitoxin n=1 Tax=Massilia scottii TaxID=3057166 RepID=UPI002796C9F2|nr:type II toxin-antitoxin system prevent-host-death family antitoxin [Massilia sp. CCM 9210]MDQ1815609.1 type II toxin-antitoxin system prevent-host-death family antitoxin [Massilia sp. CCM 9210]